MEAKSRRAGQKLRAEVGLGGSQVWLQTVLPCHTYGHPLGISPTRQFSCRGSPVVQSAYQGAGRALSLMWLCLLSPALLFLQRLIFSVQVHFPALSLSESGWAPP